MADPAWQQAVEAVAPYVIKISTPDHAGTGFLFAFGAGGGICGFATAAHALAHAHLWEQPIRIEIGGTDHVRFVRPQERAIVIDDDTDTAALVILREDSPFPTDLPQITPENTNYRVGVEVGWVGYPGVAAARDVLCFFSGRISAWVPARKAYLVDGVAISGVSGGPVFHVDAQDRPVIMGVVSAYLPNKAAGAPLPGLSLVQHIGELANVVRDLSDLGKKPPGGAPKG
jgi:hypothetical protein